MKKEKVMGVIGGMGPYAGLDLVKKIFDHTDAHNDHAHLPVALLSYPERIPDRSSFLFGHITENPGLAMAEIARQLELVGVVAAGIPCNTAHAPAIFDAAIEDLRRTGNSIRLINMIEATADFIRDELSGVERVGLMSTTAVFKLGLYEKAIRERGFQPIMPDEEVQESLINPVIFDEEWGIKAQANPVTPRARQNLLDAIEHLRRKGADAVVLGCTELPLAVTEAYVGSVAVIDPTVVLARALIKATYPEQLRPLPVEENLPTA